MQHTPPATARKELGNRGLVIYAGLITALGAFAVDSTLPMFVAMAAELGTGVDALPQTITVFLFAIGIGQLIFGPLSDRYGRRPVLAVGLSLNLIGALVCYFASTLDTMLLGRVIQGFGSGVGPAVGRAMLRDRFTGDELARQFAISVAVFSIGPIVGPLLGVSLVALGGSWRMIFGCMVLLSAGLLVVLVTRLPETLTTQRLDALKPRVLVRDAKAIVGHPQSRYFMAMGVLSYVIIVFVLAGSPVVYAENFGVTGALFAILFALHAIGIIIGQVLNHRSISRFGSVGTALWAACWMALVLASMWGVSAAGLADAYVISGLIVLFAVGFLTVQVNSNALAMTPHGRIAGFAASFLGSSGQIIGSIVASAVLPLVGFSLTRWTAALMITSILVLMMLLLWIRRHGFHASDGHSENQDD